jgi:hypothetical protein
VPETAKTRQPRQTSKKVAASGTTPEAVAEDAAVVADPSVADDAVETATETADVEVDDATTAEASAEADEQIVEDVVADVESDAAAEAEAEVEDSEPEPEPEKAVAKPAPKPVKAPSKSQVERELKAAEKRRTAAEAERRKADFNAARLRQQEADRVQLWAERRQAEADKARAKAEKAAAKAAEVRKAAGDEPTGFAARQVASAERWEVYTQEKLDRTQSDADALRKRARKSGVHSTRSAGKVASPGSRQWVPPTFITVGLLGVIWLVVYYITASTSIYVPGMSELGGWNVVIGMGLMASAFGIATLWK